MKFIIQFIAFAAIFGTIYLAIMNGHDTIALNIFPPRFDAVDQVVVHSTKTFNIAFYTLSILCAGIFSGICLFIPFYLAQTEQLYAYKRELEKSSIKTDSSNSQVKVLQSKVQVLEKALKEALEKNNYLN